jgi:hypothetical protein
MNQSKLSSCLDWRLIVLFLCKNTVLRALALSAAIILPTPLLQSQITGFAKTVAPNSAATNLQTAYFRAFRFYSANAASLSFQSGIGTPEPLGPDAVRTQLSLTGAAQSAFAAAATSFGEKERWVQVGIHVIVEQDLASHPGKHRLSPEARVKVHELFSELELNTGNGINSIHRALGASAATRLDNAVLSAYGGAGTLVLAVANTRLLENERQSLIPAGHQQLSGAVSAKPMDTGPVNCLDTDPEEEQDEADACTDDGGTYNLENCSCDVAPAGGGGGGEGPASTPTVTVSSVSAYYGQAFDPQITATVAPPAGSGIDPPVPTGAVNFLMYNSATSSDDPDYSDDDVSLNTQGVATSNFADDLISVGNYNTYGEYGGDGNYTNSSGQNSAVVYIAPTIVAMTGCPTGTVTSGQTLSFDISVTWSKTPTVTLGGAGVLTPTGQVTLTYSNSPDATGQLSPGVGGPSTVTIPITVTGTGSQTITPGYDGDNNYAGSDGEPCTITVN